MPIRRTTEVKEKIWQRQVTFIQTLTMIIPIILSLLLGVWHFQATLLDHEHRLTASEKKLDEFDKLVMLRNQQYNEITRLLTALQEQNKASSDYLHELRDDIKYLQGGRRK